MRRRGIFAAAALGIGAVAFSAWARPDIRLAYNPSPSAPRGWYAVSPLDRPPQVGDHVLAWPPAWARQLADRRRYVPATVPLMKPVAAVAGARACRTGMWVTVDGRPSRSPVRAILRAGRCRVGRDAARSRRMRCC